jgi:ATP synthase protein I
MKDKKNTKGEVAEDNLKKELASAVFFKKRRLESKEESKDAGMATALGLFGMVGWSMTVPVILFLLIGQFVIKKFELNPDYLLNFIVFGLGIGIYNTFKELRKTLRREFKKEKKE